MKRTIAAFAMFGSLACGSDSTGPTAFAGSFGLEGVVPDWNVPGGSIMAGCMKFQPGGVLVRTIIYDVAGLNGAPASVKTETDTWSYSVSGSEVSITGFLGSGVPETMVVGTTAMSDFTIYTTVQAADVPVSRTLRFEKGWTGCF